MVEQAHAVYHLNFPSDSDASRCNSKFTSIFLVKVYISNYILMVNLLLILQPICGTVALEALIAVRRTVSLDPNGAVEVKVLLVTS